MVHEPPIDQRDEQRSNIFVIATLYAGSRSSPVRVRNMSRNGALIEGTALPVVGTAVRLARGTVTVSGEVVRADSRGAGLRFVVNTSVADWLPNGKGAASQQLADEMAYHARLAGLAKTDAPAFLPSTLVQGGKVQQLREICRSLERAGELLAADLVVAACHTEPLQMIDVAAQRLAKFAEMAPSVAEPQGTDRRCG